jgi:hypothetical protein
MFYTSRTGPHDFLANIGCGGHLQAVLATEGIYELLVNLVKLLPRPRVTWLTQPKQQPPWVRLASWFMAFEIALAMIGEKGVSRRTHFSKQG